MKVACTSLLHPASSAFRSALWQREAATSLPPLDTDGVVKTAETLPVDLGTAPDPASPVGVTVIDG